MKDSLPALAPGKDWKLVWQDEFEGTRLDDSKWNRLGDYQRNARPECGGGKPGNVSGAEQIRKTAAQKFLIDLPKGQGAS